jgi:predicted component of type VI protein secretion system
MNNSKTLEPVEVYFKIQLKELPLNPVFVPQSGYLLSPEEFERLKKEIEKESFTAGFNAGLRENNSINHP